MGEGDAVDAQVEGLGGVEGVIGQWGCYFQEAVHFVGDAVFQGDTDFLSQKRDAPGDTDFFDDGVFGEGGVVCGGCAGGSVKKEEFLLFRHGGIAAGAASGGSGGSDGM